MPLREVDEDLLNAADRGHLEKVRACIDAGADVNVVDICAQDVSLHFAARRGLLPMVDLLARHGAKIDARGCFGRQPLHVAAQYGCVEVVEFLLRKGAGVGTPDDDGKTPLDLAAYNGHLPAVKFLLEAGADPEIPNGDGKTPLERAGEQKHEDVCAALKQWIASEDMREKRRHEAFGKLAADVRVRQQKLGSLRTKGPSL